MKGKIEKNEYFNIIYRFIEGQLSDTEIKEFDNLLANDTFLSEATDAYKKVPRKLACRNIEAINFVNGRIQRKVPYYVLVYLIVIMFIVSVFVLWFIVQAKNKTERNENILNNTSDSIISDTLLFNKLLNAADTMIYNSNDSVVISDTLIDSVNVNKKANDNVVNQSKKTVVDVRKTKTEKRIIHEPIEPLVTITTNVIPNIYQAMDSSMLKSLDVLLLDGSDSRDSAKASDLVNVTGANIGKESRAQNDNEIGMNAEPHPLGGFDKFNRYVESNLRYPETTDVVGKLNVEVFFLISKNGEIKNVRISNDIDNAFAEEAKHILLNGPSWSPAVKDGVPIDNETSIRFTFKP